MNANELKSRLDNYKDTGHPCSDSDIGYITLPLFVLHQKLFGKVAKIFEQNHELSNSEADVLGALLDSRNENHTLSPTKLYESLFFSSGGMTKVLNKLEEKKFIRRLDNPEDKRSKLVQLTENGKEVFQKAIVEVIAYEEEVLSHITQKERELFSKLLFKSLEKL